MLNESFQHMSLKWKCLTIILQEIDTEPFWIHYLEGALWLDLKDFLRYNFRSNCVHHLFKIYQSVLLFWKILFKEWFEKPYVTRFSFWNSPVANRCLLFNSALRSFQVDLVHYNWLKDRGAFTLMEVQAIWEFLSKEEQHFLLQYFPNATQSNIQNLLEGHVTLVDKLFGVQSTPRVTVKGIYSFLIQESYGNRI